MILDHKTKWLGALLIAFGALQAMSDTVRSLLDPTSYAIFTIVVGVLVTTLGAIQKGTGGVIASNRTWLIGVLLIALGAVQGFSDQIKALVTPEVFSAFTIITGVAVAVLGFLNTASQQGSNSPPSGIGAFLLVPLALMLAGLGGCSHTREAYKVAAHAPNSLEATAYVVTQHYIAVAGEAARLKNAGTLQGAKLAAVLRADDVVRPLINGDPKTNKPGLIQLVDNYKRIRDAKSGADLQAALDAAALRLADLINALK
jgi:hypothetical protein